MSQNRFPFMSLSTVTVDIERPSPAQVEQALPLPSSTLHEAAGKIGALPSAIKPVHPSFRICGAAVTVQSPPADNLWLHRAIVAAQPGDVLVVHVGGHYEAGYWGEVMSQAARARGLAGLVIDGCVRDGAILERFGFPVFARGLCIRGTGKDFEARGWINAPTLFGDVTVQPGDLIVGDTDGVVAIPRARVDEVLAKARQREEDEARIIERLAAGENSLDIYGWNR
ncbi:4-carboxy-4-hydroxy-2-oxoadipate aldolase/oxaloacetate decarboxylase [Pigmentiphaga sp.]|uniref:4-carboxy-4-hydroxy-2-oxoadipate aldolase/oxaloacetate decarboxylase n=1 Tax=Pigmentiphaga sp. TaxID=1977564 RepID=UPI00128C14C4|nr:4-carboxy-4-hydroxy-2-oxoadipate aldolase/oxaloacetate decarboxylase [Pigmentiphaga sp.]MPS29102.1 4-carboxy-4-hydroxy-2-oxoadipate aldolase/oxaloacetate decarboxylase [Alcaligenaceae bacterium SAGV5]MPS54580.1 4-carboxy-4-hydroxy-2-oxoadipate aldolase/oxaloacetate decarboxylase [Alcaligenaceae bacterium SAGV3]MPT55130.1 4-carboxy-4-hydroxy-2-oxoadipate aldolase/oxaloacetate decarboxylase [Alcaligenaceae bacterium]